MSVELTTDSENRLVTIRATGKLTTEDYQQWVPQVEEMIQKFGKIRMIFAMHDFHGWKAGAVWEDVKFDLKHFADIERVAMVGEAKWEQGMSTFCRPFTAAKIQYFDSSRADEARPWAIGH